MAVIFTSSNLATYAFATANKAEAFVLTFCGVDPPKKKATPKLDLPKPESFEELKQLKVKLSEPDSNTGAKKIVSANFGARNEKTVKQLYTEHTGNVLSGPESFTSDQYPGYSISGRCDGTTKIGDVKYVVEIKTRSTNKLGMTRNERIQCLSYCNNLGIDGLVFVEQLNDRKLVITQVDDFRTKYRSTWDAVIRGLNALVRVSELARASPELYISEGSVAYDLLVEHIYWV